MSGLPHLQHKTVSSIALIALLFLGSCKMGPNYTRPEVKLAPAWQETGDKRLDTAPADYRAWWRAFNDPTMDRLVRQAYQENLPLKVAGVRVIEAWAQLGVATGQLYPQTQQLTGSVWRYHESAGTPIVGTGVSAPLLAGSSTGSLSSASPPAGRSISGANSAGPLNPLTPACRPT